MFQTRVFDRAILEGLSDSQLAARMGIPQSQVSRVRRGELRVTASFIRGALRAFPALSFDELFTVVDSKEASA